MTLLIRANAVSEKAFPGKLQKDTHCEIACNDKGTNYTSHLSIGVIWLVGENESCTAIYCWYYCNDWTNRQFQSIVEAFHWLLLVDPQAVAVAFFIITSWMFFRSQGDRRLYSTHTVLICIWMAHLVWQCYVVYSSWRGQFNAKCLGHSSVKLVSYLERLFLWNAAQEITV